jgi:hypothetical protein
MNTSTKMIIGFGLIAAMVFYQIKSQIPNNNVSNDKINATILNTQDAFKKAETSVLGVEPSPEPDAPLRPDPDPEKCICKGTGKIVQGDGHVSECPYHGSTQEVPVEPNIQYFEPESRIYVYPRRQGLLNRLFFN